MLNRRRKKVVTLIVGVLLLSLVLVGCGEKSYETYEEAVEKTENIRQGKMQIDGHYSIDFNEDALTDAEFKEASQFSEFSVTGTGIYDKDINSMNFFANLEIGNMGFDLEYYDDQGEKYIKIPFIGKYIALNNIESMMEDMDANDLSENFNIPMEFNEEIIDEIAQLWSTSIKEENVFKGEDILLTTPDGDVKVTEYSIEFSDAQLKELIKETVLIYDESIDLSFMEEFEFETFKYLTYVDIDGYIIEEHFEMVYLVPAYEAVEQVNFSLDFTNYDIDEKQSIDIPEITEDNLIEIDNLESFMEEGINIEAGDLDE